MSRAQTWPRRLDTPSWHHELRVVPIESPGPPESSPSQSSPAATPARRRWWMPNLALATVATMGLILAAVGGSREALTVGGRAWWSVVVALHLPLVAIAVFLAFGVVERVGYFWRGRRPEQPGRLPDSPPKVCVQLPMYNEHEVAARVIEAACAIDWPRHRFEVQVLDDSTDADTRVLVDQVCQQMRASGVDCRVLRRSDRQGYKAGALEAGRRATDAGFLVIFDADFVPPRDFVLRAIPHFYDDHGRVDQGLALVQAQWGHLNHDESALTRAQSLWVDDHHTVQMSWRSAQWGFVNFTGTAGVWRAAAVEATGGWRAASLVEDCELSFRHLFAGYRTTFVKDLVAPAELPATYTAYKAQQKRWTQGWMQLQRLHLRTLATRFRTTPLRRMHLLYHMCIPWQWALWGLWITVLPLLIFNGLWLGALGATAGFVAYLAPTASWLVLASVIASLETRHTYAQPMTARTLARRLRRVVPYALINTGMLPHQFSAFTEGLFGPMHSEFERTPKAATVTAAPPTPAALTEAVDEAVPATTRRAYAVKVHWPYLVAEAFFVIYQLAWAALLARHGIWFGAVGSIVVASCVMGLAYFYGDHADRRCLIVPVHRTRGRDLVHPAPDEAIRLAPGRVCSSGAPPVAPSALT